MSAHRAAPGLGAHPAAPPRSRCVRAHCDAGRSRTQRMFDQLAERGGGPQAGGAGGGTTYADLQRLDAAWLDLRTREVYGPRPEFVRRTEDPLPAPPALDVVVAGGTLGIFLAAALQAAGLKVAVVERGEVKGRAQEWNLSKKELVGMIELGVLSGEDAAAAISIEFNPVRAGFHGGQDVWTRDVLNIGVSPARLVAAARRRFEAAGGLVLERAALQGAWVHPDGVTLRLAGGGGAEGGVTAKLLVDAMGNASPIVRQVRHGAKPDGVCLVVGTCARGFDPAANATGDVIYTAGPSEPPAPAAGGGGGLSSLQQFWEAFPAGSGPGDRTTYMFTYLDAAPERPSLEAMLEHYWEAMPRYQGVALEALEVRRILFGVFSTYRDSPLPPAFDRVLAVGDASGIQSPLSFGGLGALARHLRRLTCAIGDAVEADALDRASLRFINGYNPGLSGAWMLQRAMSIPAGARAYDRAFINKLLGGNFAVMAGAGDATLKPFLQDVIQAGPLARTLASQMAADPGFVPQILWRVGPGPLADWALHFLGLLAYTGLHALARRVRLRERADALPPRQRYLLRRATERWEYGAGLDYEP